MGPQIGPCRAGNLPTIGRMKPKHLALVCAALLLAACGGPQVRTVGNGDGPPAYELRGSSLAELKTQAARLCANGYAVLRASQSFGGVDDPDNSAQQWLQQAGDWVSGMPGNQAQATVVCRG
jgi:hypothetical protein